MTNLTLNVAVLVVLLGASAPVVRRLRARPLIWTAVHLGILTLVFDTLMIRAGLYVFDPAKILGVRLWDAPLEDFAYPVAAGIAMPALWTLLARRAAARTARAAPSTAEEPPA
jgi:lycopene cyclase domain-containing protein